MTMIESIRNFINTCPFLKDGYLQVDYLGAAPTQYVVEGVPVSSVLTRYADGGSLRQYEFVFGSREYFGSDVLRNLENSGFYERFAQWLEEQDAVGQLPVLEAGKIARRIEALSTGYVLDGDVKTARYQIQCRLIYEEKGRV